MDHDISLLTNITASLLAAFLGGYLARRVGLPTLVGYLIAGMVIGPFTPGFVGEITEISQLAEMGVIFLMFGVGLRFSLRDLWAVREVAVPGALLLMTIIFLLGFGLSQIWGWSVSSGMVLALAIPVASTVVLMRGMMDQGLLNTPHGQVAVGWTVLEDLVTVVILVLLPALAGGGAVVFWPNVGVALLKAAVFAGVMLFAGVRLLPWLLTRIAHTRSRELFILAVVAIALGTAFGAAEIFGVSLALGAFLAGVVLNESSVSHQVGAEVLPFREIFAVLFFVSVGMLVNPAALIANAGQVFALTTLIVFGKAIVALLLGLILPMPARTALVVAVGLGQIGEFSFIVGQAGLRIGVLDPEQYGLILAGALLSIMINPLMFRLLPSAERALQRFPRLWRLLDRHGPTTEPLAQRLSDHVVVVGYGRVGEHIVTVLQHLRIPHLVVEIDAGRAAEFAERGVPTLFGDAANSEVLNHVGLPRARALVVTLPNEAATELVVAAARDLAPDLPVVARAATRSGVERLSNLGAQDVIHPELEGGLEVVRHTLIALGYPASQVQSYTDAVRRDQYNTTISTTEEHQLLDQLIETVRGMEIAWRQVMHGSLLVGRTLAEVDLRARTGASIIAIIRQRQVLANPKSVTKFAVGDIIGLIGDVAQVAAAEHLIAPLSPNEQSVLELAAGAPVAQALAQPETVSTTQG